MKSKTKVLLSSGIHPEEEAGVITLNRLLNSSDFHDISKDLDIQIIPCRNVKGYCIEDKLRQTPMYIICEKENVLFMDNEGDKYFFVKQIQDRTNKLFWAQIEQTLNELQYIGVIGIISNRISEKLRCNLYYYTGCKMIDFNSYSEYIDDVCVYSRNNILRSYEFDVWVDLHESIGKDFFIYLDPKDDWLLKKARILIEYCCKHKYTLRKDAQDRKKIADGIYDINFMENRKGILCKKELILEMGIDNELSYRVRVYEDILKAFCQILQIDKD